MQWQLAGLELIQVCRIGVEYAQWSIDFAGELGVTDCKAIKLRLTLTEGPCKL